MAKEEFNEHSGLEFGCSKLLSPQEFTHDEYLKYCLREMVDGLLRPLEDEVFVQIYKEVQRFLELKRVLPDTSKDPYRNYPPVHLRIRYKGKDLDVFRNNLEIGVEFR